MRSGWLTQYWDIDAGHYIAIEHSDGMCSHYYHLSEFKVPNGYVQQGTTIAISGNTGCNGGCDDHLHVSVLSKRNNSCAPLSGLSTREVPIIFHEVGRELKTGDRPVSQNGLAPTISFNRANTVDITSNGQRLESNTSSWTFSGTADSNANRVVYSSWGNNGDITQQVNGTTSWSHSITGLVGHNRVHFLAYSPSDIRNLSTDIHYIDLYVDVNPPKTTPVVNDDPKINNWYTSDAQVTLTTEDEGSGGSGSDINNILHSYVAGVQTIRYRINEGSWQTYIGSQVSFLVSGDGEHVVQYYAIDKVGNQEAINSLTIKIDSIPPTAPTDIVEIHGAVSGQWQNSWSDPEFNWSAATDDASGIQYYRFNWAGEQFFPTNTNFAPLPVRTGSYTLTIRAVDNANNVGPASTPFYFNYDGTAPPPPEIFHTAGIASGIWQNEIRTADFYWPTPNDEGSGVNGYYLYWGSDENGTSPTLITDNEFVNDTPITTPDNAITYYLRLKSEDNVGQPSPWISYTLRYDGAIPVGTLVANYGQPVVPQTRVHLDINGSDLGSGVAKMRLSTEGYIWSEWRELEDEIFWEIPNVGRRSYDIYLQLLDGANNLSEPISDTVYLDTNIPYPRSDNFQLWNNLVSGGSAEGMQTTNFQMDATVGQGYDAPYLLSSGYILQPGYRAAILGTPTEVPTTTGKILLGSVVSSEVQMPPRSIRRSTACMARSVNRRTPKPLPVLILWRPWAFGAVLATT
ncbi:MAG: M23 family metallopeptidase [Chloroflexi bacterium]|nr:M23 family metallopeptidase [Chloroflexota bacterium]